MKTESRLPRLVSSPPANTATSPPKPKKVVLELELENDEGKLRQMWQEESDEDVKRLIRKRMYTLREERVNNHGGLKQPQATCKSPNKNGSPTTSAKTVVKKSEVKTTSTMQSSPRSAGVGGSGSKLPRFAVAGEQKTKRTTVTTTVTSPTKPKQSRPSPSAIPTRTVTTSQDNSVKRKQAAATESKLRSPTRYSPTKTKTVISSPEPDTPESPVDMMEYLDTNHPEDFTLTPEPSFEELEESFQMRTDDSDSPDFALVEENSRDGFEIRRTYRSTTFETKKMYMQHADSLKEFEMVERRVLQDGAQDFFNTSDVGFNRPQITMPDDDTDYPVNDVKVCVDDEDRVIIEELDPIQGGTLIEEEVEESHFGKEESGSQFGKNVRRSPVDEDYQHVTTTTWKKTAIPTVGLSQEPIITITKTRQVFATAPVQVQENIPGTQAEIPIAEKVVKYDDGWVTNETSVENSSFAAEFSINKKAETSHFPAKREETLSVLSTVSKMATPESASPMSADHSEDSTETRTVPGDLLKKVDAVELNVETELHSPKHLKEVVNSQPEEVRRIPVTLESVENKEVTESLSLLKNDKSTLEDLEIQKVATPDSIVAKQEELDVSEHSDKESIDLVEPSVKKEVVSVVVSVSKEQVTGYSSVNKEFPAAEPSKIKNGTTSEHLVKNVSEHGTKQESVCPVSSPKKLHTPESPTNKEWRTSEPSTITTTVTSEYLIEKKVETPESPTKKDIASIGTLTMKEVGTLESIEQKEVEVLHNLSSSQSDLKEENELVSRETSPKKEEIDEQTPSSKKEAEIQIDYVKKEIFTSTPSKKEEIGTALHSKINDDDLVQSLDKMADSFENLKKKDDFEAPSSKTEIKLLEKKGENEVPSWKKDVEPLKNIDDTQVSSENKDDTQAPSEKNKDDTQVPYEKNKDDTQVPYEKKEDETQVSFGKSENDTRSQSWKKEVHSEVDCTIKTVEPLTIKRIVKTEFTIKREVDAQEPTTKTEAEISEDAEKKELDAERKKVFEEARARFAAANSLLESSIKSSPSATVLPERKQSFNEARAKFSSLASQADESAKFKPSGRFTEVTKTVTSTTSTESYPVNRWNKSQPQGTQPPSLDDSTPFRTFIVKRNSENTIPDAPVNGGNSDAVAVDRKVGIADSPNIPDAKVTTATISLSPSKAAQEQYRTYTVKKIHDDLFEKTSTATPATITNETSRVYDTPKGRVTEVTHTTFTSSSSSSSNPDQTLDCQKPPQSPSSPTKSPTGFPWRNQEGAIGALVRKMSSQDVTTPPVMVTQKTYVTRTSSSCSDKGATPVEDWQAMVLKRKMGLAAERAKEDENLLYTTAAMAPEDINDMGLLEKMLNAASNYEQRRRIRAQMRVVKKNQEVLASADRDVTSERVVVQSRDYPKQLRSSFSSFTSASSGYSSASPSPDRERCFSPLTPDGVLSIGARNFHQKSENGDFEVGLSGEKLVCPDDCVTDDSGCYTSSISEQGDRKVSPFVDLLSDNMGDMYVSGVNLNDVHDEVHLHELLDSTEDYEDRKKIRARLKDVMAYNRAQREEMIKRREEEREEMLKNRVRDAEEQKRRTLAMYDAMAKSAPAGGHKTMDVSILRDEMQDVKENLLPSNDDYVHGEEPALSCWQLVKNVQTQKLDSDGSHIITTNACWSYSNGKWKSSGPSTPTLPDGKLDMVEEGIRQRVRESDERKKKILAAYDQAAKSGPAGAPRFVDFDNVNIENFDPQHNPPRFTSTVQIKGGIPITMSHGNSSPIVGPVHPKAHGYDPMEEAIRKRQREADERKRRTLEAYDKAQKSRPAGAPVSVYIPQVDDVEPVVEIIGRQQRAPTGPQFKPMGGGSYQQQQQQQQQKHQSQAQLQLKTPPAPPPKASMPPKLQNQQEQRTAATIRLGGQTPNAHTVQQQQRTTIQQQQQHRQQQQYSRREYYEEEEEEEEEEDEDDY